MSDVMHGPTLLDPVMCENPGRMRISGTGVWTLTATPSPPESVPGVTVQGFQSRTG
jgi:hypothetical protein